MCEQMKIHREGVKNNLIWFTSLHASLHLCICLSLLCEMPLSIEKELCRGDALTHTITHAEGGCKDWGLE
jgi:hypothetical protein